MKNKRKFITTIIVIAVIALSSVMTCGVIWYTGDSEAEPVAQTVSVPVVEETVDPLTLIPLNVNKPAVADSTSGVFYTPGVDILTADTNQNDMEFITSSIKLLKQNKFNSIYVVINANNKSILNSQVLDHLIATAKINSMDVYVVINIFNDESGNPISAAEYLESDHVTEMAEQLLKREIDGIYLNAGTTALPKAASADIATKVTDKVALDSANIRMMSEDAYIGFIADSDTKQSLEKGVDTLAIANSKLFNGVMVNNSNSTKNAEQPFNAVNRQWKEGLKDTNTELTINLSALSAAEKKEGYTSPDQLVKQMVQLSEDNINNYTFDSVKSLINDKTGSTKAIAEYISGELTSDLVLKELTLTSPEKTKFTTSEPELNVIGGSDPTFPVMLNGEKMEVTETGFFSTTLNLKSGSNKIVLEHKDKTIALDVNYEMTVLEKIAPEANQVVEGNTQISVNASALKGSNVSATLNGSTIKLVEQASNDNMNDAQQATAFVPYAGTFKLPEGVVGKESSLGSVKFTASNSGTTQSLNGGAITLSAKPAPPPPPPPPVSETASASASASAGSSASTSASSGTKPTTGKSGLIGEVSGGDAETLDGEILDNRSRPTYSYLPEGTVDYVGTSDILLFDTDGTTYKFRLMDYGSRVYSNDIKMYEGSLPSTNAISVDSVDTSGRHDIIKFNTEWKAPFKVTLGPQSYKNPYPSSGRPDYAVSDLTYEYFDIEFAYATSGSGDLDLSNSPVFSSAEWLAPTEKSTTLRLHLREPGSFYGWDAEYDSEGKLVFSFLHPAQVSEGSLEGTVIMLDPGHGGKDVGALGSNKQYSEAKLNLDLAFLIKGKLEAKGATVIMTRTDDTFITLDERAAMQKEYKPDIFVSVHRNASTNASANGYENYYYNPYSQPLAESVYKETAPQFTTQRSCKFYPFYVTRATSCPSILTENGFVTNAEEFTNLCDPAYNEKIADATVKGIENYFQSIQ